MSHPFPCLHPQLPGLIWQWVHIFRSLPFLTQVRIQVLPLLLTSLAKFNPRWTLAFLIVFACLDSVPQLAVPAFHTLYASFSPAKIARSWFYIHAGLLAFLHFLCFGADNSRAWKKWSQNISFLWFLLPLELYLMGHFQADRGRGQSWLTKSRDMILLLALLPTFRILHFYTSW